MWKGSCLGSWGWRRRVGRRGGGEEDQGRRVEGQTILAEREGYHDHEIQPESEAPDLRSQGVAVTAATQYQVGHGVFHHPDLTDHHVTGVLCDQSPE